VLGDDPDEKRHSLRNHINGICVSVRGDSLWKASGSDAFEEGAPGKRPEVVAFKLSVKPYGAGIWRAARALMV